MSRPTVMTIDLAALKHNLKRVHTLAPRCAVIAMVKANAYGHGVVRIAKALERVNALGVASLEEGISLREAGITQPIVLMEGLFYRDELPLAAKYQFSLVVHHEPHIEFLEQATMREPFNIWLKIDTGMHRLGIAPNEFAACYQRLLKINAVKKPIGLMTHFACADNINNELTAQQIERFNTVRQHLSVACSLANSAGILAWPKAHGDWVRPGLMLYGASPFIDKTGLDHDLQPVMTLSSRLIAVKKVLKGAAVGYGSTWIAPKDTFIGIVGVGYGDGYPQFAPNGTPILVNHVTCELVGRVSMDMLTVDLTNQPQAKIGDPVILWGRGLPVERVAKHSNTSAWEILTRMTPRPKLEVRE